MQLFFVLHRLSSLWQGHSRPHWVTRWAVSHGHQLTWNYNILNALYVYLRPDTCILSVSRACRSLCNIASNTLFFVVTRAFTTSGPHAAHCNAYITLRQIPTFSLITWIDTCSDSTGHRDCDQFSKIKFHTFKDVCNFRGVHVLCRLSVTHTLAVFLIRKTKRFHITEYIPLRLHTFQT